VNDLPAVVDHAQINMYADDTELHCCGEDLQHYQNDLQSDLNRVQEWQQTCDQHSLSGVIIDQHLSWKLHMLTMF